MALSPSFRGTLRIRESLSSVFMEITAAVRNNAAADQDLKMKIQTLNEQVRST